MWGGGPLISSFLSPSPEQAPRWLLEPGALAHTLSLHWAGHPWAPCLGHNVAMVNSLFLGT